MTKQELKNRYQAIKAKIEEGIKEAKELQNEVADLGNKIEIWQKKVKTQVKSKLINK